MGSTWGYCSYKSTIGFCGYLPPIITLSAFFGRLVLSGINMFHPKDPNLSKNYTWKIMPQVKKDINPCTTSHTLLLWLLPFFANLELPIAIYCHFHLPPQARRYLVSKGLWIRSNITLLLRKHDVWFWSQRIYNLPSPILDFFSRTIILIILVNLDISDETILSYSHQRHHKVNGTTWHL